MSAPPPSPYSVPALWVTVVGGIGGPFGPRAPGVLHLGAAHGAFAFGGGQGDAAKGGGWSRSEFKNGDLAYYVASAVDVGLLQPIPQGLGRGGDGTPS